MLLARRQQWQECKPEGVSSRAVEQSKTLQCLTLEKMFVPEDEHLTSTKTLRGSPAREAIPSNARRFYSTMQT